MVERRASIRRLRAEASQHACLRAETASVQAQEKIEEGKALFTAGNRMGAIKAFEEALEEVGIFLARDCLGAY